MAVKPLALRKLEKQSKNIYEAVVVMSKRARQINQERYEEKEKVTTEALDQFLSGEIEWKDLNDED